MMAEDAKPLRRDVPVLEVVQVQPPGRVDIARALISEYVQSLGVALDFQQIERELAGLPGDYAAPSGLLVLAWVDGEPAGCGALRAMPDVDHPDACEMKRLYVKPAHRGTGLGRQLVRRLMDHARAVGYSTLLLDTLDDMEAARGLYLSLGFEEVPPYYYNPLPGAHYLKADLRGG